jgi:hypothetical protein
MSADEWTQADNHPTNGWHDTPDVGDMTLQELTDWAALHGHELNDVRLEYGGCGSHAIELWLRNQPET